MDNELERLKTGNVMVRPASLNKFDWEEMRVIFHTGLVQDIGSISQRRAVHGEQTSTRGSRPQLRRPRAVSLLRCARKKINGCVKSRPIGPLPRGCRSLYLKGLSNWLQGFDSGEWP